MEKNPHTLSRAIVNNVESPFVKLRSIDMGDCQWTHGFWQDKFKSAAEVMVPHMGKLLKGDIGHAYNNFKIAAGLQEGEHKGMWWHDGDFYKWMESALYIYAINKDPEIDKDLDEIIKIIGMAQEPDGYLSTPIQIKGLKRFSEVTYHELYNSGHLLTSACIHYRVTGKQNFLAIATKHADYLYQVFQPRPKELARFGFNPSQIMGLVELYRTTREEKYLELAGIFVDMRGSAPVELHPSVPYWFIGDQCQMRTPLREENEAVGHAVLAMYLYAGAADVYAETGEKALLDALERLWSSAIERKMYLTGALGQVHHGARGRFDLIHEGFIEDYMLPNSTAYNETCANIANAMFNWRMLSITGEAKYGDVLELVMYNSALSGISIDGKHYFYANPLRMNFGAREYTDHESCTESPDREPYLECFCCPPNLVRTLSKLSGWAYSLSENGLAVNLYGANTLDTHLMDGSVIKLSQETQYPWEGRIEVHIETCKAAPFELQFRIPEWAEGATVFVNQEESEIPIIPGTFAKIERVWKPGDQVVLDFPMSISFVEGHARVEEVRNQVALKRGPVIYCIESPDIPQDHKILDVYIHSSAKLEASYLPDFLGGLSVIKGSVLLRSDSKANLYKRVQKPQFESFETQFIPYFSWSNRGMAEMTVFMPIVWDL